MEVCRLLDDDHFLGFHKLIAIYPLGTESAKTDPGGEVIRPPVECLVSSGLKFPVRNKYPLS